MSEELLNINETTNFVYKNVGYGLVSYEAGGDFDRVEGGRLYTHTFDAGMDWSERNGGAWVFDGGLGLKTYAVLRSSVPEGATVE